MRTLLRGQWRPALVGTLVLLIITGFAYPGVVTGVARALFPEQAEGSLVRVNGRVVGSALIGQKFTSPWYFHSRPSATDFNAAATVGSNRGPTDAKLADTMIVAAVAEAAQLDAVPTGEVAADRATMSASGIDPHISPLNAQQQLARVAAARGQSVDAVRAILDAHTEGRTFGILGERRVNVLLLNIALDSAFGPQK
jgi:K+-transporting ATPase ATPase C chain